MAMQQSTPAAWNAHGFDLATGAMSLKKVQDEACDSPGSKSTASDGSECTTPKTFRSDKSGFSTPVGARALTQTLDMPVFSPMGFAMAATARTGGALAVAPCSPVGFAVAATAPMGGTTAAAPHVAMGSGMPMGGAAPQMWQAWPQPQQLYSLPPVMIPALPGTMAPATMASVAMAPAAVAPADAAAKAEAAARNGDEGAAGPQWRLVWCHERCHKQESMPKRQLLAKAAADNDASLVCLKKADKFSAWVSHAQRPPYVLLSDWRECKPCLHALEDQPAHCQPIFTAVLAEDPRQFERAAAWAASLPSSNNRVVVAESVDMVKQLLREWVATAEPSSVVAPRGGAGRELAMASPQQPPQQQKYLLAAAPVQPSVLSTVAPLPQYRVCAEPCAAILSPLRQGCGDLELAELLRSAMPEYYDD